MASSSLPKKFRTSICIGCTGMLNGALNWLVKNSQKTVVVSRNPLKNSDPSVVKVNADWKNSNNFMTAFKNAANPGEVDLILLWIHDSGKETLKKILEIYAHKNVQIYHVLSSTAQDLESFQPALNANMVVAAYRTVKLGVHEYGGYSRWLTDKEISDGAIEAMANVKNVDVGRVPAS